jgi:callose synthase
MRNLLQEFTVRHGRRKPTILGVREHVFTGSISTVFVTLSQRVLANPLKIRMHYGHPDVFDRLWFLTRGGISKASRTINISEDIFAGFNCTLRGGNVTHHEYIQVKASDFCVSCLLNLDPKQHSFPCLYAIRSHVNRLTRLELCSS